MKRKKSWTIKEVEKELARLEPKNIVDYILQGSAITQFMKKHLSHKQSK